MHVVAVVKRCGADRDISLRVQNNNTRKLIANILCASLGCVIVIQVYILRREEFECMWLQS